MLELFGEPTTIFLVGLAGGCVLGLAARAARFCTLGMIEDFHYGGKTDRLWMWIAALGVAIFLNFLAQSQGWADLEQSRFIANQHTLAGAFFVGSCSVMVWPILAIAALGCW